MKFDNQLRYAVQMVGSYQGEIPLHSWLKQFFKEHPQMGSKDRKQLAEMVYCFYRMGHGLRDLSMEERILAALFLCNQRSVDSLQYLRPGWNEKISYKVSEKFSMLGLKNPASAIFPWAGELSEAVDPVKFSFSHLEQPDFFLRIRPGYEQKVLSKMEGASLSFERMGPNGIRLANGTRVDDLFEMNKEIVVQDFSSQRIGDFLLNTGRLNGPSSPMVWDCCAGSGGKSIMLYDLNPSIDLTVSDIRPSILANLEKRFVRAGIKKYRSFKTDLAQSGSNFPTHDFDLILADVPCSGSGTWSRTPEGLYFYDAKQTGFYQALQKKIVSNLIPHLKKTGILVYVTCSVFKNENEMMGVFVQKEFGMSLIEQRVFTGYVAKADSMFASVYCPS
jgi:16S rRNA (cytosine967-C5)-methyltransferase